MPQLALVDELDELVEVDRFSFKAISRVSPTTTMSTTRAARAEAAMVTQTPFPGAKRSTALTGRLAAAFAGSAARAGLTAHAAWRTARRIGSACTEPRSGSVVFSVIWCSCAAAARWVG